ncbi:MAG: hypothetical protein M5T61_05355 [Acidimicrobiia bacterium]|nr:hypothetical protein [Acidimicrobiia bacterium]
MACRGANVGDMVGAVIVLVVMFVVGPVAVMMGGAAWSAAFGLVVGDEADRSAEGDPADPGT